MVKTDHRKVILSRSSSSREGILVCFPFSSVFFSTPGKMHRGESDQQVVLLSLFRQALQGSLIFVCHLASSLPQEICLGLYMIFSGKLIIDYLKNKKNIKPTKNITLLDVCNSVLQLYSASSRKSTKKIIKFTKHTNKQGYIVITFLSIYSH